MPYTAVLSKTGSTLLDFSDTMKWNFLEVFLERQISSYNEQMSILINSPQWQIAIFSIITFKTGSVGTGGINASIKQVVDRRSLSLHRRRLNNLLAKKSDLLMYNHANSPTHYLTATMCAWGMNHKEAFILFRARQWQSWNVKWRTSAHWTSRGYSPWWSTWLWRHTAFPALV